MHKPISKVVAQIDTLNLTGNIVPHEWFYHIGKEGLKGYKPDLLAVLILAEIVYWYRSSERKNRSGKVTARANKFHGDELQKSYDEFAKLFCVSKRQVKAAVKTLEGEGLIKVIFRNLIIKGALVSNVMYVVPVPDAVEEICASSAGRPEYKPVVNREAESVVQEVPETTVTETVFTSETPIKQAII